MVFGIGPAGTGKTYLAVAQGVAMLQAGQVDRIILSRPAVEAGERLGFLPGDLKEKVDPYLRPLYDALHDMMPGDQVIRRMGTGEIEVAPLAFMRGRTLAHAFVILDEAQNTTPVQMKMFLTRMGEGTRMVITGDLSQVDLPAGTRSGLRDALETLEGVAGIGVCRFDKRDVVRHPLVARIVDAYDQRAAAEGTARAQPSARGAAQPPPSAAAGIDRGPSQPLGGAPASGRATRAVIVVDDRLAPPGSRRGGRGRPRRPRGRRRRQRGAHLRPRGAPPQRPPPRPQQADQRADLRGAGSAATSCSRSAPCGARRWRPAARADHLAHLVVHGGLHLRGHDHHHPGDARRMEMAEARILHRLGVPTRGGRHERARPAGGLLSRSATGCCGGTPRPACATASPSWCRRPPTRRRPAAGAGARPPGARADRQRAAPARHHGGRRDDPARRHRRHAARRDAGRRRCRLIRREGHSRMPVYREQLDDIVGMIHIKDVFAYVGRPDAFQLEAILRRPLMVAPQMPVLDLLLQMRQARMHLALVVDEYGGIDGLLTIEDLVETIVGDIADEHDEVGGPMITERRDGSLDLDARLPVEEFEARLGHVLTEEERDADIDTVGGLVFTLAGRVPARGEVIGHPSGSSSGCWTPTRGASAGCACDGRRRSCPRPPPPPDYAGDRLALPRRKGQPGQPASGVSDLISSNTRLRTEESVIL